VRDPGKLGEDQRKPSEQPRSRGRDIHQLGRQGY
jgi:hypothetical protein